MNANEDREPIPDYVDEETRGRIERLQKAEDAYVARFGKLPSSMSLPLGWKMIEAMEEAVKSGKEITENDGI